MGWSESISLTSRILTRSPGVLESGGPVDQLPAHVGRGGQPVDLDHVVFPLDAVAAAVYVLVVAAAGRVVRGVGVVVTAGRRGGRLLRGQQLHAAFGAAAGLGAGDLEVHGAGVHGRRPNQVPGSSR